MSRLSPLAVPLAALVLAAAAAGAAPGPSFRDRTADSAGAPDVSLVTASSDAAAVTFVIRTASAASWAGAAAILEVDADGDPSTGDAGGGRGSELSYVLHSEHDRFTLDRSGGESVPHPAATATLGGATLTIRVPRSELGATATIGFSVSTPAPAGADRAPDSGEWRFSPDATVTALVPTFAPVRPVHGKVFALRGVRTVFSDGTSGTAGATCTAKLGATALRRSCRWRLPATARGKRLTVVVRAAGRSQAVRFNVR